MHTTVVAAFSDSVTLVGAFSISLVPRLSVCGWSKAWYTLIADPPTFPRGFLSQCVIICNDCLHNLLIAKTQLKHESYHGRRYQHSTTLTSVN